MKIIYEDNHLLVTEKPPNMPVQKDSSHDPDLLSELKAYVKQKYEKPGDVYLGLVHRLDRPVGGVMVFARTSKAAARLSSQFSGKGAKKCYAALVMGSPEREAVLLDYLLRDERSNNTMISAEGVEGAKPARMSYTATAAHNGLTLLNIALQSGRHHQIRVQLASRGIPIWGDQRYNPHAYAGQQIALWAYSLEIEHPTQRVPMRFISLPTGQVWDSFSNDLAALLAGVRLVYIDDNIIAADKQAGLSVAIDDGEEDTLEARLRTAFGEVYAVHRLDATTTGLVLFARSLKARRELDASMRERGVHKVYHCIVKGRPKASSAVIEAYSVKDPTSGYVSVYDSPRPGAKKMITSYRLLEYSDGMSMLEVELLTGRTHQIRAHLAHIGIPVLGDDKYGDRAFNRAHRTKGISLRSMRIDFDLFGKHYELAVDPEFNLAADALDAR